MGVRTELRAVAQVPLAQVHRVITRALQQSRKGDFAGGQAHVLVRDQVLFTIFEVHRLVPLFWIAIGPQHFHELRGSGRKFEAKPGGVASGHERSARWRASGVAGVADPKIDALLGDRINVGGGDCAARDPTAVERDVIDAQIVGYDQDDIGGPHTCSSGLRFCGVSLPLHFAGGRMVFAQHILHHQQRQSDPSASRVKTCSAQGRKRNH